MTEDKQSITAMVELVSGALRMLSEQVGKIEKRLDGYHIRLKILEDDFDEVINKDTIVELPLGAKAKAIDMVLAMPSGSACCDHGKCKKHRRTRSEALQL